MADMKLLKQLRQMTHAPLKDCKSALDEAGEDLDRAQEILREKGALKAAKKADRETNEWVTLMKVTEGKTVGVKIACETDFVAKNPAFLALVDDIMTIVANGGIVASIDAMSAETVGSVDTLLKDNFLKIGEAIRLVDGFVAEWEAFVYLHPGNKVASAVFYDGDATAAKGAALQVAAMDPSYLSEGDIPQEKVEELTSIFKNEVLESGKPEAIHAQIIQWKIKKEYRDLVLLNQSSIMDDSKSVGQFLTEADTTVTKYIRYAI